MALSVSNVVGLSLLTGTNLMSDYFSTSGQTDSLAVRIAKAGFTTVPTTPPWKETATSLPISSQIQAIKASRLLIDKPAPGSSLPPDVQTAFTVYKALDKLRLLSESAAKTTISDTERTALNKRFTAGLAEVRNFLAQAPTDKLNLAFETPTPRAESIKVVSEANEVLQGAAIAAARGDLLVGVVGTETLAIHLTKFGVTDTIFVDLSTVQSPRTLDGISGAINAAIASFPKLGTDGMPILDANGNQVPRYSANFEVTRNADGKWGLTANIPSGEQVAIDDQTAKDSLIIASGLTTMDAPTATRMLRFDDPVSGLTQKTLGTITATNRLATEQAQFLAPTQTGATAPAPITASLDTKAVATDAEGFSYVVGTSAGDLGTNRADGANDLFLTKLDSEGRVVWQRTMGAIGSAEGAAVSIASNGDIIVAGTVEGAFGASSGMDSDILVARFDTTGDEKFAVSLAMTGNERASAVTVGPDGSIYVGGSTSSQDGDAFLARIDAAGVVQDRRVIGGVGKDGLTALAVDGTGAVLALTNENGSATLHKIDGQSLATLSQVDLGQATASSLAVSSTGSIAVGGATSAALSGPAANAHSGGLDGFVMQLDSNLAVQHLTYLGTAATDRVDSLTYMGGNLYAGGRTTGDLAGTRRGPTDGFIARIDTATGATASVQQFGYYAAQTGAVSIAAAPRGSGLMGAIGLHRGTLTPVDSTKLIAQTSLRAGDQFSFRINGGEAKKIVIQADDTMSTLAARVRTLASKMATVTTPSSDNTRSLRIDAKAGTTIEFLSGPAGSDALSKLGLKATRISAAPIVTGRNLPKVTPGGSFALNLSDALSLADGKSAAYSAKRLEGAVSMIQTAYRSLYWDDSKANLVNGMKGQSGAVSPYLSGQLSRYQDALRRLSGA